MSPLARSLLRVVPRADDVAPTDAFAADMLVALRAPVRSIAPKYFYDQQGSALFDAICELPEYYPTRTELGMLRTHAPEIAQRIGAHAEIVEFGAGSLVKIRLLLDALEAPRRFLPVDISADHLHASATLLKRDYPGLRVLPVAGDYSAQLQLPAPLSGTAKRVGFFPGSTIGNFTPLEAVRFLRMAGLLLQGGALIVGADLVKEPAVLHAAYNDAQGVTAAFNLNLLARANRELGTDFDLPAFAHSAFYNAPLQRIEMHLVSRARQTVTHCGERFEFAQGETLHTENSYKFTIDSMRALAVSAGLRPGPVWTDADKLFSLHWLDVPTQ